MTAPLQNFCQNHQGVLTYNLIQFLDNCGISIYDKSALNLEVALPRLLALLIFLMPAFAFAQPYGQWSQPINVGPPINSSSREELPSLNAAQNIFVINAFRAPNLGGIFISRLIDGQWSEPQYNYSIGSPSNLEPALSPDGNEIYFSCYCGGYGDYDIWKVVYDSVSGTWSEPINPGPNVNDSMGQAAPFISYDGQKLYHSESSCRFIYPGLVVNHWTGSEWSVPEWVSDYFQFAENASLTADERIIYFEKSLPPRGLLVFYSWKDSTGNWTEPVQFAPINDSGRGYYPRVSPDGNTVYYYSERTGGYGYLDIWKVERITDAVNELPSDNAFDLAAYPNPFNSNITIVYSASNLGPQPQEIKLVVYDIQGRVVRTLVDEHKPVGTYRAVWDGKDDRGIPVASGNYIAKLSQWGVSGGDFPIKITLVK